jgi:hypothetical protein
MDARASDDSAAGPEVLEARRGQRGAPMIPAARLLTFMATLNLCWLECAQNPLVFCYRIGWDLLAPLCKLPRGGNPPPPCSN